MYRPSAEGSISLASRTTPTPHPRRTCVGARGGAGALCNTARASEDRPLMLQTPSDSAKATEST